MMVPSLKLLFLGSPYIERDGEAIELTSRKEVALLAYLAATGPSTSYSRDALCTLLWPDYDQRRARTYLRQTLWLLNRALGKEWLEISREYISLNPAADIWLDVTEFQRRIAATTTHGHPTNEVCADCLASLTGAVELYRGDFLAGFTLPDAPHFDEWQFFQAESLRQVMASALDSLVQSHSVQGDTGCEVAIPYARRRLALDPLHEPSQRQLMQLYAWTGQQAAAVRQYQECVRLLEEELGISPDEETTQLYEAIKARKIVDSGLKMVDNGARVEDRPPSSISHASRPSALPLPSFLSSAPQPSGPRAPFVARERELAALSAALETTRVGRGQILFVIGGAGRGKTMLVQEFAHRAQAADTELMMVSGQCNAHTGLGDPYLPFREALNMLTGELETRWAAGLITRQQAKRLWQLMPVSLPALIEHAPDLIENFIPGQALLNRAATFARGELPWFNQLTILMREADRVRLEQSRLFSQYTALLKAIAARQPLLFILEDLHWVDNSSSALLFHLSREVSDSRILIVGTYRPDEVALSWGDGPHPLTGIVSELKRQHGDIWLDLGGLAPMEGRQFVEAYLDTQPNRLGAAFREALFRQTEGHALFTVELLREMQARGDLRKDEDGKWTEGETINWNTLPAKVDGVIEKRMGRLGAALQTVLTVASVEGETFTAEVVARVQQLNERELVQQLSGELDKRQRLITAQGLEWVGEQRLSLYRFRHYLFQHYLYRNLDQMERTYLHEAVGNVLETLYGEQTEQVAVQLARHFEQAGLTQKAVNYLLQAGKRASQLSAHEEAITHLTKGLALLEMLSDSPEHTRQELDFQITLGNILMITRGYAAPEVGETFNRARELCQRIEEMAKLFSVLHGLYRFYLVRGELQTARELGEQLLHLAQSRQDPVLLVGAHRALGNTLYYLGEFNAAQAHFEQSLTFYDPQHHRLYVLLYGQDEGIGCLSYMAWTLWHLGYPDQALKKSQEALNLAQALPHPYSLAYAQLFAAIHSQLRREVQATREQAEAAMVLSTEQGFTFWAAWGMMYRGWALVEQGQGEEGISQISQGLADCQAAGAVVHRRLALLAEAYGNLGQPEAGLRLIAEALTTAHHQGDRRGESELYRLKGELLLKTREADGRTARRSTDKDEKSPEECFLKAIEVAQRQNAKSLELRATVSLGRLWQQQGKKFEARQMLAEIYGWFTEGFNTVDLKEAKVLLEELA
jgi:predicted ATPase